MLRVCGGEEKVLRICGGEKHSLVSVEDAERRAAPHGLDIADSSQG